MRLKKLKIRLIANVIKNFIIIHIKQLINWKVWVLILLQNIKIYLS